MVEGRESTHCHPYPGWPFRSQSALIWAGPAKKARAPLPPRQWSYNFTLKGIGDWCFSGFQGIPGKNGWRWDSYLVGQNVLPPGTMGWQYWAFDLPYTNSFIRRLHTRRPGLPPTSSVLRPSRCITPGEADQNVNRSTTQSKDMDCQTGFSKNKTQLYAADSTPVMATVYIMVCYRHSPEPTKLKTWGLEGPGEGFSRRDQEG